MLFDQSNQRKQRYKGLMLKTKVEDIRAVVEESFKYMEKELVSCTLDID